MKISYFRWTFKFNKKNALNLTNNVLSGLQVHYFKQKNLCQEPIEDERIHYWVICKNSIKGASTSFYGCVHYLITTNNSQKTPPDFIKLLLPTNQPYNIFLN